MPGAGTGTARPGLACLVPLSDRARDTGCDPGPILRWLMVCGCPPCWRIMQHKPSAHSVPGMCLRFAKRPVVRGSNCDGLAQPRILRSTRVHAPGRTGFFAKAVTRRRPAVRAVSVAEPVRTEGARVVVAMVDWPAGSIAGPAPRPELKPTPAGFRPIPETTAGINKELRLWRSLPVTRSLTRHCMN